MKNKYRVLVTIICLVLIFLSIFTLAITIYVSAFSKKNINFQSDEKLFELAKKSSITEYYKDERKMALTYEEYIPIKSETLALNGINKSWVSLEEVNKDLINAFITVEDRKFYSHSGFNFKRTIYALANTLFHFKNTFGASTITQQVIKNISGDNEITFKRKFSEILRAYNIEKNHTKEEILEVYLNIIPMGENIVGISSACEMYFGKIPAELTLEESATLVGITNAPTRYNPRKNPEECLKKRNEVLYSMYDFGVISEDEYKEAKNASLIINESSFEDEKKYSWFIETVNNDVINALSDKYKISLAAAESLLYNGGLKIYTTINTDIQEKLEEYFENQNNFPKEVKNGLDFSMVVCDSENGNLLGIIGSCGEKRGNRLLNLALTPRTPGSSLKPLALYAPLINSGRINWATVFDDVPIEFKKTNNSYIEYPQNYPRVYDGLITVKDALRLSKNTVAIRLYQMLGAEEIYRNLKKDYGFDTIVRRAYDSNGGILTDLAPSPLALGQLSYGVSLRKLTEAYTVFPSEGTLRSGRSFVAVLDENGEILINNSISEKTIYKKETARIMNKLLMNVTESGTASKITLKNIVDTAGKTGTSGEDKDRLFIGYTPYVTAGIWCGYRNSEQSIGNISKTHIKIWDEIMKELHKDLLINIKDDNIKSFSTEGVLKREYCKDSGKIYTETCEKDPRKNRSEVGYFLKESLPRMQCDRHIVCKYDTLTESVATENCDEENIEEIALIRIEDRKFPKEIIVTDAEYVYRETDGSKPLPDTFELPFFYNYIEEGTYVGRGRRRKQFNSSCYLHND